jgi:MFS family permease
MGRASVAVRHDGELLPSRPSGIMNSGSALAAILSPLIGGWIIDATGNWDWPFIGSIALMLVGALLAFTVKPEKKKPMLEVYRGPRSNCWTLRV